MKTVFTSQSPAETKHHGDDAHNFLTDLDYGYTDIQDALRVTQEDQGERWFGIDCDGEGGKYEHAVRYNHGTSRWEVAVNEGGAFAVTEIPLPWVMPWGKVVGIEYSKKWTEIVYLVFADGGKDGEDKTALYAQQGDGTWDLA